MKISFTSINIKIITKNDLLIFILYRIYFLEPTIILQIDANICIRLV